MTGQTGLRGDVGDLICILIPGRWKHAEWLGFITCTVPAWRNEQNPPRPFYPCPFVSIPALFNHSEELPRQRGWRDDPRRSPCVAAQLPESWPNPSPTTRSSGSRCAEIQAVDHVGIITRPDFWWSLHVRSAACLKNVITQAVVPS